MCAPPFFSMGGSQTRRVAEPPRARSPRPQGPRGSRTNLGVQDGCWKALVAFEALVSSLPPLFDASRPLFSHPLLCLLFVDTHTYPQVPSQLLRLTPSRLSTARQTLHPFKKNL